MRAQGSASPDDGLVIVAGYGLKIYVQRGHLIIEDGAGRRRKTRRFNRATGGLCRVVVLGHDGYITLEALHWLREVDAAFVQLDHHGKVIVQSAAWGADYAKLRRSQATAVDSDAGLEVARWLLAEKLAGQAAVAGELASAAETLREIEKAREAITAADSVGKLVAAEAAAASSYWQAWGPVQVPFPPGRVERLPEHWLTFGKRHSLLTRSTRMAANPTNAILNYAYALLEAETTIALQTIGVDPGLGIFHADKPGRASMSLDVMEACRPAVDAYLLALLRERVFSDRDFVETARGACRLSPTMAKRVAKTTTVWASHVAPVAERVAQILAHAADQPLPTRLTNTERARAWDGRRSKTNRGRARTARLPDTCRDCGGELPDRRHRYCPSCRTAKWSKAGQSGRQTAANVLQQLRDDGHDPAHGGQAAKLRGKKNANHQAAAREWNARNDSMPDPAGFAPIAAALRHVPIADLQEATGLSKHYCSLIRLRKKVPHPRHWDALRSVADLASASGNR